MDGLWYRLTAIHDGPPHFQTIVHVNIVLVFEFLPHGIGGIILSSSAGIITGLDQGTNGFGFILG